jgi:DNA-binding CsgD family transcriptional regulator
MRGVERARERIRSLCRAGLDSSALRYEALAELRTVVPAEAWCWPTADPATLLVTGSLGEGIPEEAAPRFFEIEYTLDDFNKFAALATAAEGAATLSTATGAQLDRSPRWLEIFGPLGYGDDLRAALTVDGACWGYLALHRAKERGPFSAEEVQFVADVSGELAEALRTALVLEGVPTEDAPDAPGLLVLDDGLAVQSATAAADRWLAEISSGEQPRVGELPNVIYAVAARLRALDPASPLAPRARLRSASGRWLVVHASRLAGKNGDEAVAIVIEPARPAEVAPLIAQAYELTEREREVTQLVTQGLSTLEIAARLHISPTTVQDHLKAIFAKVGVRSRRELVAQIFAEQYWPRIARGTPLGTDGWFRDGVTAATS